VQKIQKQAPNFEKNYATSFKQAMDIINEKGNINENTQFQSRSVSQSKQLILKIAKWRARQQMRKWIQI